MVNTQPHGLDSQREMHWPVFLGSRHERSLLVWEGPKCKRDPWDSGPLHLPAPTVFILQQAFHVAERWHMVAPGLYCPGYFKAGQNDSLALEFHQVPGKIGLVLNPSESVTWVGQLCSPGPVPLGHTDGGWSSHDWGVARPNIAVSLAMTSART